MIDRINRDKYAELLRHFASGQLSNKAYEKQAMKILEQTNDLALEEVYWQVYNTYDDFMKHRLTKAHALTKDGKKAVARWVLFLCSNAGCEEIMACESFKDDSTWKQSLLFSLGFILLVVAVILIHVFLLVNFPIVLLIVVIIEASAVFAIIRAFKPSTQASDWNKIEHELWEKAWDTNGVWPFKTKEEFENAKTHVRLLTGKTP